MQVKEALQNKQIHKTSGGTKSTVGYIKKKESADKLSNNKMPETTLEKVDVSLSKSEIKRCLPELK